MIRGKTEETWRFGVIERAGKRETTDRVSGRKARKRSRRRHGQGDSAIRAQTWQDVTCGEQEEETGQI